MATFPDSPPVFTLEIAPAGEWVDVTSRLQSQVIPLRRGRANESGQPQPTATSATLDNLDGWLMPDNPMSPWWPHIDRGLEVRESIEGQVPALRLPGVAGSDASTPNHASFGFAGPFDFRAKIEPDLWTAPSYQIIASRWDATEQAWFFGLFDGRPVAGFSNDGSDTTPIRFSSAYLSALRATAVAMTVTPSTGTVQFWSSPLATPPADITQWDLFDTVTGDPFTIHPSTSQLRIGSNNQASPFAGRVLWAELRDGINGSIVTAPRFTDQTPGVSEFTGSASKTWTLNGDAAITRRRTRFVGTVAEIDPDWPHGDTKSSSGDPEATVHITAAGILRRLNQGTEPTKSTIRRHVVRPQLDTRIAAYWPMEDTQSDRADPLIAGPDTRPVEFVGFTAGASVQGLPSAAAAIDLKSGAAGSWQTSVGGRAGVDTATEWTVETFCRFVSLGDDKVTLLEVGTQHHLIRLAASDSSTTTAVYAATDTATPLLSYTYGPLPSDLLNEWLNIRVTATQQGNTIFLKWEILIVDIGGFFQFTAELTGVFDRPRSVTASAPNGHGGLAYSHLIVSDGLGLGWLAGADTAWVGETAAHRFARLCGEEGIPVEIIGDPRRRSEFRGDAQYSEVMGPQEPKRLLELLTDCADLDMGEMMSKRTAAALVYRTRRSLVNQTPAITFDGAANEFIAPLNPVLDDRALRNVMTVKASAGTEATVVDAVSVANEKGEYKDSETVAGVGGAAVQRAILVALPLVRQAQAIQNTLQAGWRLHIGTQRGLRVDRVASELKIAPAIIEPWLDAEVGDRIRIVNLPKQHSGAAVELIYEGSDEQFTNQRWTPRLNCSPGGPWLAGELTAGGPAGVDDYRLTPAPAALVTSIDETATTVVVSGVWVTDAAEYPLRFTINGEQMDAAAAAVDVNQTTFTGVARAANGVTKAHTAGDPVTVTNPLRLIL